MTICEQCQAKIPTMKTKLRRVNLILFHIGKVYHSNLVDAFGAIDQALISAGFPVMGEALSEAGNSTGAFCSLHANLVEGKWLHVFWHRMPSGRFEVTACVN